MDLLNFLFPKKCVGCGKEGKYFCHECSKSIKTVFQVCPVCERQFPFGQTHRFCYTRHAPNGLISLFAYEGIIREAIHKLKYKFITDLEKEFWEIIKENIEKREEELTVLKRFIDGERPTVISIPLHRQKENFRGFNQSSLFAKSLAYFWELQFSDKIIVRKKNVLSQTKLTRKEREENVKGVFSISANSKLLITNCILVDDVWTTGSTLKEAARVLKENGAKKVWGLTIAR